ncbi:Counting factor associated protein D [Folsomia candida]|uniref:Counting factor associated protein D n=1 Tax=Folsomia candida TaxID=158441 RepID=A0A226F1S6_FOLCA|nr:Counting factor associated protein D [Folsomia candida]
MGQICLAVIFAIFLGSTGVSKTFQLSKLNENGVMRKVVPVTNEQYTNKLTCFEVNGTANAKVTAQSVLPDTSQFQFVGTEIVNSVKCKKYALVETKGQKVNKYTYWVKVEPSPLDPDISLGTPVKYEMRGYNTLLGSHYDHYYLIYDWFSPELPTDDVFQVPPSLSCGDFPGPGVSHHKTIATFNPMKEFIHNEDRHVQTNFEEFINTHNKQYKHDREHHHRLNVLRGRLTTKGSNGALPSPSYDKSDAKDLPPSFDWRLYGAVTPVKGDQSVCGSCWSFGTIGTIEGANFLKTGTLVRLSQQALVDCSWGFGNNGCDGGEDFRSYQWIMKHGGVPSEDSYGPYLGIDAYCHVQNSTMAAKITGYVNVTSGDSNALKFSMLKNGPISVGIDASHKTLSFYANGVYYDPQCKNGVDDLDHAVLLTGYGTINGQDYWLIKNSWSTYWGNDGYVLMSQKDNNCGVSTAATYVTM